MRGKELKLSELTQFDGSAFYAQGLSAATVAIHGPTAAKQEDYVAAVVCVRIINAISIPTAGGADRRNQEERKRQQGSRRDAWELTRLVERCVDATFMKERYPRCVLNIDVTIMSEDGSLSAVVLNAVMYALLDAGVPCRTTFAAVSVAAVTTTHDHGLEYLLDPTALEEEMHCARPQSSINSEAKASEPECVAHGCFVMANPLSGSGLLASKVQRNMRRCRLTTPGQPARSLTEAEFRAMASLAERAAVSLFGFLRQCNVPLDEG